MKKHYIIKSRHSETYLYSGLDSNGNIYYCFDGIISYSLLSKLFNEKQDWLNQDGAILMCFNTESEVNSMINSFENSADIVSVAI